jgi:hypothetical protein
VDFWRHIFTRRNQTSYGVGGDSHRRHRRLLHLLEARIVAEEARNAVGDAEEFSSWKFTRDISSTSGFWEIDLGNKAWVFMGFIPQRQDGERGLLAELSADEEPAWQLAAVLRELHQETALNGDDIGHWRQRRLDELRHEERDGAGVLGRRRGGNKVRRGRRGNKKRRRS